MRSRLALAAVSLLWGASAAHATVHVAIDLTHQRMHVNGDEGSYDWPISSARSGFSTPGGSFAPTHLELMHYSKKYHMSPMPHAIFFRGGYAIHGTYSTGSLGRPASHGCVRLSPGNAAALYAMVQHEGARISISGSPPASAPFAVARHRSRSYGYDYETASYADGDGYEAPRRARRYYASPANPSAGYGGYPYGYGQPAYYGYDATSLSPF